MRGRILFSLLDPIMGKAIYLLVLKCRQWHRRMVDFYKVYRLAYVKFLRIGVFILPLTVCLDSPLMIELRGSNDEKFQKFTEWHMLKR